MFKRAILKKLSKLITLTPVVLVNGARQTGKTTLVKQDIDSTKYTYITFDDAYSFALAKSNPQGFIESLSKPVILDEVQRVPELFIAIKKDVDEHRMPGRYILTGSANPLLLPRLGDSLAGRMMLLDLYPLSQGELMQESERFIDWAFSQEAYVSRGKVDTKESLYTRIVAGGYPEIQSIAPEDRDLWFEAYITTILYRNVQDIAEVEKLTEFPQLLRLLATRVGNLLNVSEIAAASKIPVTTVKRYLALLETIFLIKFQQPWSSNLSSRLIKSPKVCLLDTGLLCFLLGITTERALKNPQLMGPILENFVLAELLKQATWNNHRVQFYHFRTTQGIEVDILLEDAQGNRVAIEVKNSSSIALSDFKGLAYLQELLGDTFIRGIILYTGNVPVAYNKQISALPVSALWNTL